MTRDQLDKGIARLKKHNPAHPMISVIESCELMHLAMEYVKLAMADPIDMPAEEYTVNGMHSKLDHLYSQRAVRSNKFHDCKSDAERRQVSVEIGSIQTDIIKFRRLLGEYYDTGKLPKKPVKEMMPSSGEAKHKKICSLRTSISRYKGLIRGCEDEVKVKEYESRIRELNEQVEQLTA